MKSVFLPLLLLAALTSCKKDCDCPDRDSATTTTATTADENEYKGQSQNTATSPSAASSGKNGKVRKNTGNSDNLSHPAPDGTDAENHDDDYYTRNDTTRKPTGTTIK